MGKQIIKVPLRAEAFRCGKCGRMVDIRNAKSKITETDESIIYGWDYGHEHKTVHQFINGKSYILESDLY